MPRKPLPKAAAMLPIGDKMADMLMFFADLEGCGEKNRALAMSLREKWRKLTVAPAQADGRRRKEGKA